MYARSQSDVNVMREILEPMGKVSNGRPYTNNQQELDSVGEFIGYVRWLQAKNNFYDILIQHVTINYKLLMVWSGTAGG